MSNEYKLQKLVFDNIQLLQQGLPTQDELIKECSNLFCALNFIGNTANDTKAITGKLNSLLSSVRYNQTYTQGLFSGYYQIIA